MACYGVCHTSSRPIRVGRLLPRLASSQFILTVSHLPLQPPAPCHTPSAAKVRIRPSASDALPPTWLLPLWSLPLALLPLAARRQERATAPPLDPTTRRIPSPGVSAPLGRTTLDHLSNRAVHPSSSPSCLFFPFVGHSRPALRLGSNLPSETMPLPLFNPSTLPTKSRSPRIELPTSSNRWTSLILN